MGQKSFVVKIEGLFIGEVGSAESRSVSHLTCDHNGITGDRHYGFAKSAGVREKGFPKGLPVRNNRQFSAVSAEELAEIAQRLGVPVIEPQWLGANIVFSGCDWLSQLPPLTLLRFDSGPFLRVFMENQPCLTAGAAVQKHYPGEGDIAQRFVKQAWGKGLSDPRRGLRGLVGWVEGGGIIRETDGAEIVLPDYWLEQNR